MKYSRAGMKRWGVAIIVAGALLTPVSSAAAKPGFFVEQPRSTTEFKLPARSGYHLLVSASSATNGRSHVYVDATRKTQTVDYFAHGTAKPNGTVLSELPGVGRIAVRLHITGVTHEGLAENCKGRPAIVRHGMFRGVIEFHGEHGYTTVDAHSARGTDTQSFREVCDQGTSARNESPQGEAVSLFTGTREGTPYLYFEASLIDFGNEVVGPLVSFNARSIDRRKGLSVISSTTTEGKPAEFSSSTSPTGLEDATVEPPAPFRGSGRFHLTSATSSTWEGNLETELPGIGEVSLAGSDYWSTLCKEKKCTKTLPSNVRIGF